MFGSGLSKRRAAKPRTTCSASVRRAPLLVAFVAALGSLAVTPAATAANLPGTGFSGAGTWTNAAGTLYAKASTALTLTANTDSATRCVEVVDGSNTVIATNGGSSPSGSWVFNAPAYPWLVAGSGNGTVAYTLKSWKNYNDTQKKCTGSATNTFPVQTASYVLDNAAPTATGTLSPVPNAAGWTRADTTVTWTGADIGGSGVATVNPQTSTVTTDGITARTTTVTDNAGNSATSAPVTVKLDKTAPSITGSRSPAPNANGWNNTDVTVSFSAQDATSGVKTSTGPTTLSGNGADQSVRGTATDNADNSASTSVGGINIDKTAPTLSGKPTSDPNTNGWFNDDVTVHWTATDTLSGTTSPADSTITGEGTGLTATASVTDLAGNSSGSVASASVRIDRTAPTTTVTAPPAWNSHDLTLALVANDGLSGVDRTRYVLDGVAGTGTSVQVSTEGQHTLEFWSTDVAGNTESAHTVTFGIDKSAPTIGHTQDPAANADGWNNTDVTVTFDCSDAVSGVASCTGPRTVTDEGASQVVTGTVEDNAGNRATDPASVSIDKTAPTIAVDDLPKPNANGWYDAPVTATWTATDALSGVRTADRSHTFGEGADQTATGTATDVAGNSASATTPRISVDTTAPTITGDVVETPGPGGWFTDDVTVHWTCGDHLSSVVSCPADTVVDGEGGALAATASVTDRAGNTATATVDGIRIDRHAPTTTPTDVPSGWVNAPVSIGLSATDALSDVDTTYFRVDGADHPTAGHTVTIGDEGVHTVRYWSVDQAGNAEDAGELIVRIDLSGPAITPSQTPEANANGWNNTDVDVSFACEDQTALSGLAQCPEPTTVTTEGRAQRVTGTATDHAGNRTSGTAVVNIDKTAPSITGAPDRAPNAAGWYADDVTVSFVGSDELSGIADVTAPQHLGEGAHQSVDGAATDNAGNTAGTTVSGIDVDETAPDLSAAPTTLPNANGWYNTDVTQVWAASDALSGLAGETPAPAVLDTEGRGETASATVRDVAGNRTTATSEPVDIDKTAPTTDASAPGGWTNRSVEVVLTPHDALSGVAATHYRVDGGARQQGTSVVLDSEGTHTIAYASTDRAGNDEAEQLVTVRIDRSAPTITHTLAPQPNRNGWNNTDVTVTFTCADQADLSGVASCTAPQPVTDEGRDQLVTGTATDNAGNSAEDPATVSLDRTAPRIEGRRTPLANAHGWNNTDVTVHFDGTDGLSGIDELTPDRTFGEGTDQSLEGRAVDAAGNEATATVGGVNVDETAPTLRGEAASAPNAAGWYRGDVTIAWTADDDRSGVEAPPADGSVTGEGTGLRTTATVSDLAGNSTTTDSPAVNIDRTAPTTGADAPTGWNHTAVAVTLDAADGLSGVDATYYALDGDVHRGSSLTIDTEGVHSLRYWSVDNAGNEEAPHTVVVRIDLTAPGITHRITPAPNARGWNNSPVTVAFECSDELSGIADCPKDATVDTDGAGQAVPGTATDRAGNTRTDDVTISIDTVDPTITGAPDRAANVHGWYDAPVTVGFTCDDALSGIADCTSPVRLGEGGDQAVDGTATDAAGNRQHARVAPVNVDTTAPVLTGQVTGDPNAAGWYHGDVTVRWTASDALSGLDGPAPADSTIDSEGRGLTAGATVRDLAGNQASATSDPVRIDRTAPSTTVSDVSDWSNGSVTIQLDAGDNLSGVAGTHYRLDDDPAAEGTSVTVDAEGVHTLQVWSVDVAGNVEARQDVVVRIDRTAPGISHSQAPAANARGWNNSDVTVTFTCTDEASGIADCTAPVTRGEGASQRVVGTATDRAGNVATDETTVNVDETRPTVTARLSDVPNAHGWFSAPVVATFTCADQDALSGVRECPAAQTLGEGRGQSVVGSATDAADNVSTEARISGIDVDVTRPDLAGTATTEPNADGWYRGDVTVRWTASDELSGLDGPAPADTVVTGEGDSLSASTAVRDLAGNTRGATVGGIRIDRTAPSTVATAPRGWQNDDVTVRLEATDALSGVATTRYSVDGRPAEDGASVTVSAEGSHEVAFWSVDRAGNREATATVTVLVDKSAPVITGRATTSPNAAGWYRTPVTVTFECRDAVSGIASCQPDATVAGQGANAVTGTAVDNAGNKASTTVGGINVDTVAPAVTVGGVKDGAVYTLGAAPQATASATDGTSGLAAPAGLTTTGGTANGVGTFTVTASATDRAGNTGTATATYRVVYGFGTTLFLQPVNDTAHQTGVSTSVFNAGQAIPMKFQLRNAAGQVVRSGAAPQWLVPVRGSSTSAAVNEAAYGTAASVGSAYTWDGSQYLYNWKTEKSQAGSYWRVGVALDDGQTYYVNVGLR